MAASGGANEIATAPGVAGRDWVELGRVLRPYGLDGGLLVALHSDAPENLLAADEVALRGTPGTIPFAVDHADFAGVGPGGRARVRIWLETVDSRERAERWAGAALLVPPHALPTLPAGEFYWRDLIGLEARAHDGRLLGRVAELVATAGADVLVLRREGCADLLLPVVAGLITRLDREHGELWLDPAPEHLGEGER